MKFIICAAMLAITFSSFDGVSARRFTKCEVAQAMYATGEYTIESLPDWMCLVNSESSFNSSAIGGPNTNGSSDWGLFQVNDNFWCTLEGVGKDCNVNCWDLVDDYLEDDLACISIIYARHGFDAWRGWTARCQNDLADWQVTECF